MPRAKKGKPPKDKGLRLVYLDSQGRPVGEYRTSTLKAAKQWSNINLPKGTKVVIIPEGFGRVDRGTSPKLLSGLKKFRSER